MDELTALHTAARHACLDRAAYWEALPERADRDSESLIPSEIPWTRITVVEAILHEIERLVPDAFASPGELRAALLQATYTITLPYTEPLDEEGQHKMSEEQARFVAVVGAFTTDDLRHVRPLPYRHVLTDQETNRVLRRVDRRWNMRGPYWYPLLPDPTPPHLLAVQAAWFWRQVPMATLRRVMAGRRIRRVWQLQQIVFAGEVNYEMEPELLHPLSESREAIWTADRMDWVLRASHESSITLGGPWLIGLVKELWPGWHDHLYHDFFMSDRRTRMMHLVRERFEHQGCFHFEHDEAIDEGETPSKTELVLE